MKIKISKNKKLPPARIQLGPLLSKLTWHVLRRYPEEYQKIQTFVRVLQVSD